MHSGQPQHCSQRCPHVNAMQHGAQAGPTPVHPLPTRPHLGMCKQEVLRAAWVCIIVDDMRQAVVVVCFACCSQHLQGVGDWVGVLHAEPVPPAAAADTAACCAGAVDIAVAVAQGVLEHHPPVHLGPMQPPAHRPAAAAEPLLQTTKPHCWPPQTTPGPHHQNNRPPTCPMHSSRCAVSMF